MLLLAKKYEIKENILAELQSFVAGIDNFNPHDDQSRQKP